MASLDFAAPDIKVVPAPKTLEAFTRALLKDGGNLFRKHLREQLPKAEDAYKEQKTELRTHLGGSQIGRECNREIWYGFRWVVDIEEKVEWHEGEHVGDPCKACLTRQADMIRLLNRGHLEEPRFVSLLLTIGCQVWQHNAQGKQFKVSLLDGHYGGSCDCVAVGIPDLPEGTPALVEMKTYNQKNFEKLLKGGVKAAKPQHHHQMQTYMGGLGLSVCLYLAVNKNNDAIYAELIAFDYKMYVADIERARTIVYINTPPKKISNSPAWHICRICEARFVCHKIPDNSKEIRQPMRNCRTCIYSKPVAGDQWACGFYDGAILSKEKQILGCGQYTQIGGM